MLDYINKPFYSQIKFGITIHKNIPKVIKKGEYLVTGSSRSQREKLVFRFH